jgi:4-amino-4-deoxy-L-arabinose transferase-like glycosyltransferase
VTALPALKAARPALLRSWREPVWRDQDYWPWLLIILGALLAIRLIVLFFAKTDLFFDEAQYWSWSRDLAFGYFSKPPLIAWLIRLTTEVCGDAEWCVRAPSPVLYTVTSVFVFLSARALYDARIGFWSAVVFATLPAVSVSSLLISTDVPLILCWAVAFYGWIRLIETRIMAFAVLMGASLGLGLLAKYAAAYFILCTAIDAWRDPRARDALRGGRGLVALAIALLLIAPNLIWNARHSFATFSHTAENAGWRGFLNLGAALEFLGSHLAVFGPILFAVLIVVAWRALRRGCEQPECRLLAFSVPVILLLVVQAFLSRALANWAAAAYPAATILVTAELLRHWARLFRISLWLHVGVAIAITIAPLFAPRITALTGPEWNPYTRVLGWRDLAASTGRLAAAHGVKTILADSREVTAELLYYLRDTQLPIAIWWFRQEVPRNHFEMTRPFTSASPEPVLYVTLNRGRISVPKRFDSAEVIGEQVFPADSLPVRYARFTLLKGYEGDDGK